MPAKIYYASARTRKHADSKIAKIARLCDAVGLTGMVGKGDLTAVKLHFGEYGCDAYLNPALVRKVVDKVEAAGGKAFLTDTNTLYSGSRHNAVDHLHTAYSHGFVPSVVHAPVIIADGVSGLNNDAVAVNLKHFEQVFIAREIRAARSMVVLTHFKGHEMAGFGGAIKNLAMGCAGPLGKRAQHNDKVKVDPAKCIACAQCVKVCPEKAASIPKGGASPKAVIDSKKCIGCFECVTVCEPKAVAPDENSSLDLFVERMTEYAYGAVQGKEGRVCYLNFVLNVTPDCDCAPWSDTPLVPDLGILAGTDPVALDRACFDLVKASVSLTPTEGGGADTDKFTARWPKTRCEHQLAYGQAIGLGEQDYELIPV
jgi:uncharacterized Fe-S center protein